MSETTGREALAEWWRTFDGPAYPTGEEVADSLLAHIAAVLSDDATWRDLTHAIMAHYGYTPDDVAYAEGIHPERICDDECPDHGGVWRELGQTAAVLIDVAQPFFAERFGIEAS